MTDPDQFDTCDHCGSVIDLSKIKTFRLSSPDRHGVAELLCLACYAQVLKEEQSGDGSEINIQQTPEQRARILAASEKMESANVESANVERDDLERARHAVRRKEILWALMGAIVIAGIAGAIVALIYAMTVRP